MNIGLKLFLNTFLGYFSFGLRNEHLYQVALQSKNNVLYFSIISFSAFIFAILLNYSIGFFIRKYSKSYKETSFTRFLKKFSTYVILITIPFNGLISQVFSILYGFLHEKLRKFLFLSIIGRAIFIFYYLL